MIAFHDCSNSPGRPAHRGGGGPFTNDVMAQLRQYASDHGFCHVNSVSDADIIITNDIFTSEALVSGLPLIKRMDGIFWQREFMGRNAAHKLAADQADTIVFISDYSRSEFERVYGKPRAHAVTAVNWADTNVYYPAESLRELRGYLNVFTAATSWDRTEKRGNALIEVARRAPKNVRFVMTGHAKWTDLGPNLPNVIAVGYSADHATTATLIRACDVAINLSYRDAAPKTVAQASACGLPVLYANSGGTSEVLLTGIPIDDPETDDGSSPPELDIDKTVASFDELTSMRDTAAAGAKALSRSWFSLMLTTYFDAMLAAISQKR